MTKKTIPLSERESQGFARTRGLGTVRSRSISNSEQKELSLEFGRTYVSREGEQVKITQRKLTDHAYPFTGDNGLSYTRAGHFFVDTLDSRDLVTELQVSYSPPDHNSAQRVAIEDCRDTLTVEKFREDMRKAFDSIERDAFVPPLNTTNPKDLMGSKKPPLSLIPPSGLIHEAMAFKDGADKYGAYNWRSKDVQAMIYIDAIMRHAQCYLDREDYAEDSKAHHLAHIKACCSILLDATETGNLIDNRPVKGKAAEVIGRLTTC